MLDKLHAAFSVAVEQAVERENKKHLLTSEQLNRIGLVAAIEAMREPTPEMRELMARLQQDKRFVGMRIDEVVAEHWWPAMIDLALGR